MKEYLGDAVYAEKLDDNTIMLTTENGIHASNRIYLEPEVLRAFQRFVDKARITR